MPKSILVGFDPRTADLAPVHFGVAAARFTGAPLIVGSVIAAPAAVEWVGDGQMVEELPSDATHPLAHVRLELDGSGVDPEYRILSGASAPAGLHEAAEDIDAGLLVVGSTTRGGAGRVLTGSTAERLLHGAPCPVAVVPRSWRAGNGVRRIGVAYRDTPDGNEALDSALAIAGRAGAKVRILAAVKPREYGRASVGRPGDEVTTYDALGARAQELDRDLLATAAELESGVEAEVDVSVQDAAEFLVAASEQLDLLVCGSRGYGPKRAVLLGGVTHKVTAAAHCPVIVLARGLREGLRPLVDDRAATAA